VNPPGSANTGAALLYNLSARASIAGSGATTAGFVITGATAKPVLIRAAGPALAAFAVADPVARPRLRVFDAAGARIHENAGWADRSALAALAARLGGFPFAAGSADAAVSATLAPGSYTVEVTDDTGRGGTVLTEVYAADAAPGAANARLINLSARAPVAPGRPLVGGLVITGDAGTVQRVLVRGIGPTLAKFAVTGALADPTLRIYDSAGGLIATNLDWSGEEIAAAAAATGAFALDAGTKDAAVVLTLSPGLYTLVVSTTGAAGEALADIYALPQ